MRHSSLRSFGLALGLGLASMLSACFFEPFNGQRYSGTVEGKVLSFRGGTPVVGGTVVVEVLDPADQDPSDPASHWSELGRAQAGTTPYLTQNGSSLYAWALQAPVATAAAPERWREGGITRVRARDITDPGASFPLVSFDNPQCVVDRLGQGWLAAVQTCASVDSPVVTLLDVDPRPTPQPDYLPPSGHRFLSRKETPLGEADQYYAAIGAGATGARYTLAGWKSANKFTSGEPSAAYFNAADLALARDMHCRAVLAGETGEICAGQPGSPGASTPLRIACYVTNYKDPSGDPTASVNRAIDRSGPIATVAMEKLLAVPPSAAWCSNPVAAPPLNNDVRFYVYPSSATAPRLPQVALDSEGPKSVPGVCLACHGGDYYPGLDSVRNAELLPFDVLSYRFSNRAGWSLADQQEDFRLLNELVLTTTDTGSPIAELIHGWYAPAGSGVHTPGTPQNTAFVPAGWAGEERLYNEVVKPYCRMCHVARPALAWNSTANFLAFHSEDYSPIARNLCEIHTMPHAEVTLANFWASFARVALVNELGLRTHCASTP